MTALFLSPHNDDETLFGAFTLLRENPDVIVCLRSQVQEDRGYGITATEREAETDAAMRILGCSWRQWPKLDTDTSWEDVRIWLSAWVGQYDRIFAPAWEQDGHPQHNAIADAARDVFGPEAITSYMTYTKNGKSVSELEVVPEAHHVGLKLQALACYHTQYGHPSCRPHFLRDQREYYAP